MRKAGHDAIRELLLEGPSKADLRAMAGDLAKQHQGAQPQPSETNQQEQGHGENPVSVEIMGTNQPSWVSGKSPNLSILGLRSDVESPQIDPLHRISDRFTPPGNLSQLISTADQHDCQDYEKSRPNHYCLLPNLRRSRKQDPNNQHNTGQITTGHFQKCQQTEA